MCVCYCGKSASINFLEDKRLRLSEKKGGAFHIQKRYDD